MSDHWDAVKEFSDVTVEKMLALRADVTELQRGLAELRAQVAMAASEKEVRALREQVVSAPGEPRARYVGVWKKGQTYAPGDLATDRGCLWHCWQPTEDRPGESNDWQLTMKSVRPEAGRRRHRRRRYATGRRAPLTARASRASPRAGGGFASGYMARAATQED